VIVTITGTSKITPAEPSTLLAAMPAEDTYLFAAATAPSEAVIACGGGRLYLGYVWAVAGPAHGVPLVGGAVTEVWRWRWCF